METNPAKSNSREAVQNDAKGRADHAGLPQPNWFVGVFVPNATVFISSMCLMVVEIVAARLLARDIGSSLYTWTSIIGVVLAGISLGNYVGGQLADRTNPVRALPILFMAAALCCLLTLGLNAWAPEWQFLWVMSWPVRIALHVAFVFLLPSTVLGMISPVVAKRALDRSRRTGRTVGGLYAWGAIGSIVGTFLAGFLLVALWGTRASFCMVASVLAIMGVLYAKRNIPAYIVAAVCVMALWASLGRSSLASALGQTVYLREPADESVLFHAESQYQYVEIRRDSKPPHMLMLKLDKLTHNMHLPEDPYNLRYGYERVYAAVTHREARGKDRIRAFFIGGGGYTFPNYLHHHFPDSHIEVSEIDPVVTEAAEVGMALKPDHPFVIYDMDAGNVVTDLIQRMERGEDVPTFDFVYGDSFNHFSVPFHLVTLEFNEKIRRLLAPDGVYLLNLIDSFHSGRFLGAVIDTMEQTFSYVRVLTSTPVTEDWRIRCTFSIVASQEPLDLTDIGCDYPEYPFMECYVMPDEQVREAVERSGGVILTDDYAPVENLLAPVVRASKVDLASTFNELADEAYIEWLSESEKGALRRTVDYCEKTIRADPEADYAYNLMGMALLQLEEYDRALKAFETAVQLNPKVGAVHVNWGLALIPTGRLQEALERFEHAAELDPQVRPTAYESIGDILKARGRPEEAEAYYQRAAEARRAREAG
ncbi:MAG: fused MFS/spermidine synthase [Phycisphaerales bacterium]|nr:MAG: fused MFS/spermidine synthase [Phycisphaerales bacterium]